MQGTDTTPHHAVRRSLVREIAEDRRHAHGAWVALRRPLGALMRTQVASAALRPLVAPRRVDDFLELFDPCWSLDEVRARVVERRHETADVTSLWLQANENWRGHRAGQHVLLTVRVDGVLRARCFSLSNAPASGGLLRLTIKAHDGGCVSGWARETARVGDVVTLSQAKGDFVLPAPIPGKLLFVSGGSGLTPLVAMAQQLGRTGHAGPLTWLHYERGAVPLERELCALVRALPSAQLHLLRTGAAAPGAPATSRAPRLDAAQLAQLVPDWAERALFVCGPQPLMDVAIAAYAERGLLGRVHAERFGFEPARATSAKVAAVREPAGRLLFARSGRTCTAYAHATLLVQAERAGLSPPHGCRMGICHTCTCTKLEGSVRNQRTGLVSDAPGEAIQLCIHTPLSDVSLDL